MFKCVQVWRYRDWERRCYNNNVPNNHGYTTTQERGLGGQERQAGNHHRRSNGAIVLGTLNSLTNVVGFANNMGLFDQDFW